MDIARGGMPVLYAKRSAPVDAADSGWEFSCGRTDEPHFSEAQVWAVSEVLELEPSLEKYMAMEEGAELEREGPSTKWKVLSRT